MYRRTVFDHDAWVKHRSNDRFAKGLRGIGESGVFRSLSFELGVVTTAATFVVLLNCLLAGYDDLSGVHHTIDWIDQMSLPQHKLTLPAMPFTISMPALSLLLVFRTNTAYSRWNEARTIWGGIINKCRNVGRQSVLLFPDTAKGNELQRQLAFQTAAFAKSLRQFLRGSSDLRVFETEVRDLLSGPEAEACLAANNRPVFCATAMSATVRAAKLDPIDRKAIDETISSLVDLLGACERIFKSPIPLVYTRHTSRFLTVFLFLMPLALWEPAASSWNHWLTLCIEPAAHPE